MSDSSITPPLSQGWGYGIIVGVGLAFAAAMMGVTYLLRKYAHEDNSNFETYSTAGRSVGIGLTATAVISSWAWSTALLSSSTVTYTYGVGGAYWFAAGCIVQICLFALLAIQSKLKTPHAHTILEVVKVRYGTVAHVVYMSLCLINNLIAVINMLLGAAASISALTGMHVVASIFLLPLGVCLYTISGGLRATFVTDWAHTVALFIVVLYLSIKTLSSDEIGTLHDLWDTLREAAIKSPVEGNLNGSYLTMTSPQAVEFGILHTLGNFGLVIMDSSYWQKAYSANNAAATPGYLLGGAVYFGLPWCLGTIMGLASIALQNTPNWPTFGREVSTSEVNSGLILPYAGMTVAGGAGAVAVVIVVFMAVTSTTSAELIAVSSIVSSDIFHTYIRPNATGKQIMTVSHLACVGFTLISCAIAVGVYYGGGSVTWTLYFLGVITCPGMVTMPLSVLWSRQSKVAAIVSPLLGLAGGLATWIATAYHYGGEVSVKSTGDVLPCLFGTVASAGIPVVFTLILSLIFPSEKFDWSKFNEIELIEDDTSSSDGLGSIDEKDSGSLDPEPVTPAFTSTLTPRNSKSHTVRYMQRMSIVAAAAAAAFFLIVWIIWPFSMYGARFEFSPSFFSGWVIVPVIWMFIGLFVVTFLPPLNGRHKIIQIIRGITK